MASSFSLFALYHPSGIPCASETCPAVCAPTPAPCNHMEDELDPCEHTEIDFEVAREGIRDALYAVEQARDELVDLRAALSA